VQSAISAYNEFKNFDGTSFSNETIGIVVGIWNIFKGVVAVGGLYGGITGKQRFVRIFGWVLGLTIVIYLGLVILSSVIHFQNQSSMVDACVHKAQVNNASGLKWDPKENCYSSELRRQLKHNRLKDDDDFGERGGTLDRLSMSSTSDKHPARGISHDN
ncbi:20549_t:CDS:2, partial [Entrophospora sp. SA101]